MAWMRVSAFCALLIAIGGLTACGSKTRPPEPVAAAPATEPAPVANTDEAKFKSDIVPPDWMQRLQTTTQRDAAGEPNFSVKSVQPLIQSANKSDTLFADVRANGGEDAGAVNARSNLGLGYRRMVTSDLMAGIGGFYDRDWTDTSARASTEAQIKWKTIDLNAGYYAGLDSAVDGYRLGLAAPLPYLPWARTTLSGSTFFNKDETTNRSAGMQIGLLKHLQLDAGMHSDGVNDDSGYVRLGFSIDGSGGGLKRYLFSREPVAPVPFETRDLTGSTLDAIPHSNIIERDG